MATPPASLPAPAAMRPGPAMARVKMTQRRALARRQWRRPPDRAGALVAASVTAGAAGSGSGPWSGTSASSTSSARIRPTGRSSSHHHERQPPGLDRAARPPRRAGRVGVDGDRLVVVDQRADLRVGRSRRRPAGRAAAGRPTSRPSRVHDGHGVDVGVVVARLGQPVGHLADGLVDRRRRPRGRGHEAAGAVLGVAEQLDSGVAASARHPPEQRARRSSSGRSRSASAASSGSIEASRRRRARRLGLAQQRCRAPRGPSPPARRRPPRVEGGRAAPARSVAPQVLQQVGQLAGAQPVQARRGWCAAAPRAAPIGVAEGLDGRPVDDPVGRRPASASAAGPSRRSSVCGLTSTPTRRIRPSASAR